jgi:prepilin peptidase CpaA
MSTGSIPFERSTPDGRRALVAASAAVVFALGLIGSGLRGAVAPSVVGAAAVFLFFAVESDLRSRRLPNLLTLPALSGALLVSPWLGGTSGPVEAALGAGLGFALLVGPYAIGGMGAGDVKALMALGAWLGPEAILGAAAWALLAAGGFGLTLLALRGELAGFAARWRRNLFGTLTLRRLVYQAPPAGSGAAHGIPFAVALAVGLTAQWLGGPPW